MERQGETGRDKERQGETGRYRNRQEDTEIKIEVGKIKRKTEIETE